MVETKKSDDEHFDVFRNAQAQLRGRGPYSTASVTRASTEGDFKLHRGLYLNLQMEDLQDAITARGRDAVVQEIGAFVLALLDTAVKEENDGRSQGIPAGGQTL